MIAYRRWQKHKGSKSWLCDGWFLFGFIPLYTRKIPN
jgi:hypothetical protein